jgi:hypothetical protein
LRARSAAARRGDGAAGAFSEVTQTLRRLVTPAVGSVHPKRHRRSARRRLLGRFPVADLVAELRRRHARVLVHATVPWSAVAGRGIAPVRCAPLGGRRGRRGCGAVTSTAYAELGTLVRNARGPDACSRSRRRDAGSAAGDAAARTARFPSRRSDAAAALATAPARRVLRALARELADRRTALVLGAGGAKGFAHVGALRAFERNGVEFDAVAGTSIGRSSARSSRWVDGRDVEALFMGSRTIRGRRSSTCGCPTEAFFRSKKKSELIAQYCNGIASIA